MQRLIYTADINDDIYVLDGLHSLLNEIGEWEKEK